MAAMNGSVEQIEKLIGCGGEVNKKNNWNWTALDFAKRRGKVDMIDYVIENGGKKYKKLLSTSYDGPYFNYQNDSIHGFFLWHDSLKNETGISRHNFGALRSKTNNDKQLAFIRSKSGLATTQLEVIFGGFPC